MQNKDSKARIEQQLRRTLRKLSKLTKEHLAQEVHCFIFPTIPERENPVPCYMNGFRTWEKGEFSYFVHDSN